MQFLSILILFLRHDINCLDEFFVRIYYISIRTNQPFISLDAHTTIFNVQERISLFISFIFYFFIFLIEKFLLEMFLGKVVKTFYYTIYYGPAATKQEYKIKKKI